MGDVKLCECGCGDPAPIAPRTRRRQGWIKGQPLRFISGHNGSGPNGRRGDPAVRFWEKVDTEGGPDCCWPWLAALNSYGYAHFWDGERYLSGHRFGYELLVGPVPEGRQLDHLCRVRHCVNPAHIEPVTQRENILRGKSTAALNAAKTHCKNGHPLDGDNLYVDPDGKRTCRICNRASDRRHYWRKKAAA